LEIRKEEARQIAYNFIDSSYTVPDDELVIVDDETIEKDYGWYFFSTSRKFLETGNISNMVAGNGPILVEKRNGNLIQLGTAHPLEHYIERYESGLLS
jgi:hypothetical protein